jgi:hypothetical protein
MLKKPGDAGGSGSLQGVYHKDLDGELRFVKKRVSLGMVGLVPSLRMVLLTRSGDS